MRPAVTADRVAYPDISYELNDIVSQQPEPSQVKGVQVKRIGTDDSRAVQATRFGYLQQLTMRGEQAVESFGHIPRPKNWQGSPTVFQNPETREQIRSTGLALKLNRKLDELLNQVAGQINDPKFAAENVQSLLPRDFKGLQFRPEGSEDPMSFIRARSIHSLDDLRSRITTKGTGLQETSDRANALLQLRTKLGQLASLAGLIDRTFSDLESVDLGRLKTPQLC